jgi:hypothetical protein
MNSLLLGLAGQVLSPVIVYLKQWGVWDLLVSLWTAASTFFNVVYTWLITHVDIKTVWQWVVALLRFTFAVLITLFQILTNLFTWLTHYFK